LIAVEKANVERYYVNPGFGINAKLSKELLITIFNPKSPLHDGAVILKGFTVLAAGVILPMTENPKLDWQYGTRHRAAIGFSEVTDALCLVVSEETGGLSIASQGRLTHYNTIENIRPILEQYYSEMLKTEKKRTKVGRFIADIFNFNLKTQEENLELNSEDSAQDQELSSEEIEVLEDLQLVQDVKLPIKTPKSKKSKAS